MGPKPAPLIPRYDLWVRKDGRRRLIVQPQLDCNWFQAMENSVDPSHLQILHQALIAGGRTITNTTRGLTDDVEKFEFYEFPYGIMKKRTYKNGLIDEEIDRMALDGLLQRGGRDGFHAVELNEKNPKEELSCLPTRLKQRFRKNGSGVPGSSAPAAHDPSGL